ncbi:E3 ubiquitin-protein ligase synoviolin A-like isoform X2 [Centruroides sculpturatus]|nr:E3 ubiquitin-protein ligase synoviolin A-like isoform X2 [Centruroides sculpturatus]
MPFPFWMPQQQQQQQQQQQTAATGETTEETPSTSGSNTSRSNNQPSSFIPPFPFLPFFIPPPPPAPATDLKRLSLEELQNMEGHERENVEARIQCLRNIQTLLDAAVLQMQQYSTLVASLRSKEPSTINKSSHPEGAESSSNNDNTASTSDTPQPFDPQAEVRRRRLQRFTQSSHNIPEQTTSDNDNNQTENEYSRHSD